MIPGLEYEQPAAGGAGRSAQSSAQAYGGAQSSAQAYGGAQSSAQAYGGVGAGGG
eukprot:CAMPEP_0172527036 /NCGR_PEP_ID=MMETSP1067-20121228/1829_1 /TAXON_ID=265564 ORGANISM="Thalassiosira punctigera, Strain Tpunct2005C2" /NCGR_SAMPLE_ID=MMETSP1067 /ASSEMBLY_ACC=CAM_ASM_000444 /LENGTH=54 /DNA_ID=CAMNT_0013310695 /DNA_START=84 /DNA_END=244 /DNA_ORIENTATION=-